MKPEQPARPADPTPRGGLPDANVLSKSPALGARIKLVRIRWDQAGETGRWADVPMPARQVRVPGVFPRDPVPETRTSG
jgi:hypothetical protein